MRIAIAYFSWTGNTENVAREIIHVLRKRHEILEARIKPLRDLPYLLWLILSFIPESKVKIEDCSIDDPDVLFLGTPKWTFSCPPVNTFLESVKWRGDVYLFITCGGFDEKRYARNLENKLKKLGFNHGDTLIIKRRFIRDDRHRKPISDFLERNGFT